MRQESSLGFEKRSRNLTLLIENHHLEVVQLLSRCIAWICDSLQSRFLIRMEWWQLETLAFCSVDCERMHLLFRRARCLLQKK